MTTIDLSTMSMTELKQLAVATTKAISTFEARRRDAARAELEEMARQHGYRLAELVGTQLTKQRRVSTTLYRDPASHKTWSGRGRQPSWFTTALNSGVAREEMLQPQKADNVMQLHAA